MRESLKPVSLRTEYRTAPLGIDVRLPRLGWQVTSGQRGQCQTAYQIMVASTRALLEQNRADLWDSGRVESGNTTHIRYAGTALRSGMRCWWRVTVWDRDNVAIPSAITWWEMGLLDAADWQAGWIGLDQAASEALLPSPLLRRTISIDRPLQSARVYATARGVYELHLDGQRLGDTLFAPGWTDYHTRVQYQTYDLTTLLQPGEHTIGAVLGIGWYGGYVGCFGETKHYGTHPELLLQLELAYADGTHATICSDATWRGTTGPILSSDMLMGETYDARRELPGWSTPSFDARAWHPVLVRERDAALLVADCSEPVRVTERRSPVALTSPTSGVYVFDMGQNMVGLAELQVMGAAGTTVQLRFAEMLDRDGMLYTASLRSARQIDCYTLRGGGEERYTPHFTFHGFRYIELTGYPGQPTLATLRALVIHSDTTPTGRFESDNPLVNQLQQNIVWGQRGNFLSVPTDCPQRDERLGWLGDAQVFIRTACYNMHVAAFFTKWMYDVVDAQSDSGAFSDIAPRVVLDDFGSPAWSDAGVIIPWTLYRHYGDTDVIARHWDAMERWMAFVYAGNPNYVRQNQLGNNYGDWLSIGADTCKELLATAYWAYDARLMCEMAQALGNAAAAEHYAALFAAIKQAFGVFVAADGRLTGDTQTAYVLALWMDLLPAALRPVAAQHLVDKIAANDGHLSTGFVGVGYLLPVLSDAGYDDVAYRLLLNDTFPSWGYSIKQGATTIWERWDGWTEANGFQDASMNSFNHYSLGAVGQWLYQYAAGIDSDPTYPGFARIIIWPRPGPLSYVRAEYESMHGRIVSEWRRTPATCTLHVVIPANTTATIWIPKVSDAVLTEGAVLLAAAEGVTLVAEDAAYTIVAVVSGSYMFTRSHV